MREIVSPLDGFRSPFGRRSGGAAWSPSALFAAGEQGILFAPSPTTCFTDTARTTAAGVGDTVAGMTDLSGNGNHATQATAASRPVLGRVPFGGRRNLFLNTNNLTNLTNWPTVNLSGMTRSGAGITVDGAENFGYIRLGSNLSITTGANYTFSVTVVSTETVANVPFRIGQGSGTGGLTAASTLSNLTAGVPQRITIATSAAGTGTSTPEFGIDTRNAIVPGGSDETGYTVTFSDPQFEVGASATDYQQVVTALDVTEAGVADCYYLLFDGADDFLVTGNIDFSATDEMTVIAGARALANATAIFLELSASAGANNGAFAVIRALGDYIFRSRGTNTASAQATFGAAPTTNIITGLSDISADSNLLRDDGTQVASAVGDQGAGNYGAAYPLYIGRRAGTSLSFNGHLHSLIVRGKTTSGDLLGNAESYVAGKTGVVI